MPTHRSFLLAPILLFLLFNLALLLSLWSKNEAQKTARQRAAHLTRLTQNLQDVDRWLSSLYQTTANPSLTSLTFLNTDSLPQRASFLEKITQEEELEKKALSALGRSFALVSLLKEGSFPAAPNSKTTRPQDHTTTIVPAVESYLDEAQKTLVLYQWLTASEKSLKPLLDFLTTLYLSLGRGVYPAFVREDLSQHRQTLKGLSSQPYPDNLPFASIKTVEARQKIISDLSTTFDQMAPLIAVRHPENVSQLKNLLVALDTSLTNDSSTAKDNEKEFWTANLQLQKSAYLFDWLLGDPSADGEPRNHQPRTAWWRGQLQQILTP